MAEGMGEPEEREKGCHCPHTHCHHMVAEAVSTGPAKNRPTITMDQGGAHRPSRLVCWTTAFWWIGGEQQSLSSRMWSQVTPPGSSGRFQICTHPNGLGETRWIPKQDNDMSVKKKRGGTCRKDSREEQTEWERDGRGRGCESNQDALHTCMTFSTNNLIKMQKRFLSRKRQCIGSIDAGLYEDSGHSLLIDIEKNEPANRRVRRQGKILKSDDRGIWSGCCRRKESPDLFFPEKEGTGHPGRAGDSWEACPDARVQTRSGTLIRIGIEVLSGKQGKREEQVNITHELDRRDEPRKSQASKMHECD